MKIFKVDQIKIGCFASVNLLSLILSGKPCQTAKPLLLNKMFDFRNGYALKKILLYARYLENPAR